MAVLDPPAGAVTVAMLRDMLDGLPSNVPVYVPEYGCSCCTEEGWLPTDLVRYGACPPRFVLNTKTLVGVFLASTRDIGIEMDDIEVVS